MNATTTTNDPAAGGQPAAVFREQLRQLARQAALDKERAGPTLSRRVMAAVSSAARLAFLSRQAEAGAVVRQAGARVEQLVAELSELVRARGVTAAAAVEALRRLESEVARGGWAETAGRLLQPPDHGGAGGVTYLAGRLPQPPR